MKSRKYGFILVVILIFCLNYKDCFSQTMDSVRVYAVHMNILYRWSLTKALIPGAVEPIVLTDSNRLNKLYSSIIDSVRTGKGKKIKSNYPFDLRLYFEFFENGMVTKEIGFTAQNEMFVNRCLYPYDKQKLKCLDEYIPDLTVTLGVK